MRWVPQVPGGTIELRYAIADGDVEQPSSVNCRSMRAPNELLARSGLEMGDLRRALAEAFARWHAVADVAFIEVGPGARADIVIGEQQQPVGFAFTDVQLGAPIGPGLRPIVGASVCLNPERKWKIGYDGNLAVYDLVHTLTHEIGHTIGLDHPGRSGHLMSFRYSETLAGLSDGDVQGAVTLYGVRKHTIVEADTKAPEPTPRGEGISTIGRSLTDDPS
ncbi:MAG: matrixin family metalloprotease [Hyphomicrobiaceae bacterium]